MDKQVFHTDRAPKPKGPYSQAVISNGILYVSGQVPTDPASGSIMRGTIEDEARLTLDNLKAIIEESGYRMQDILKISCYLASIDDFAGFNRVYTEYFPYSPPARTAIQAGGLPAGVRVEIDAIAGRNH